MNKNYYIILAIVFASLIMFGCSDNNNPRTNSTMNTTDNSIVEIGDAVKINYITTLDNGTVVYTNLEEIAIENNMTKDSYEPFMFYVTNTEKRIDPLVIQDVIGKQIGDHSIVEIPNMYGDVNQSLIMVAPYEYYVNKTEQVPMSILTTLMSNVSLNHTFPEKGWNSTITNISEDNKTATIVRDFVLNGSFNLNGFDQYVAEIEDNKALIKVNETDGDDLILAYEINETAKQFAKAIIHIDKENNQIIIDFNNPKAGHDATIEYWVEDIIKG